MSEQTITVYILTENHNPIQSHREVTGYTTDYILAQLMLQESFFGELEKIQVTQEQWDTIQRMLKAEQGA